MKNIEIFEGNFTVEQVNSNPGKIFVVSDNLMKAGVNPFRDLANVITLKIKKGSSNKPAAYYSSSEYDLFSKNLLTEIVKIKINLLQDKKIVFSNTGYGNVEKIDVFGPKIKELLNQSLKSNFNFDNNVGKKFVKIPSYNDIQLAIPLQLDTLVYNTLSSPQIIQAILLQKKLAFTINSQVEVNTLIKLISSKSKDVIVCRVTNCHSCVDITPENWSLLELSDVRNYDPNKFQIFTEFICSVNPSGLMNFNSEIFGNEKKIQQKVDVKDQSVQSTSTNEINISEKNKTDMEIQPSNSQIIELLQSIESKLDLLIEKKSSKKLSLFNIKNLFQKKTLNEILFDENISGEVKDIGDGTFEIVTDDKVLFVKLNKGLFKNSIKVVLTKSK